MKYKIFSNEEIDEIYDLLEEIKDDEYSFQAGELGMHSTPEEKYDEAFNSIISDIESYNGEINFEEILSYDSEAKTLNIEDPIHDIADDISMEVSKITSLNIINNSTNNKFKDIDEISYLAFFIINNFKENKVPINLYSKYFQSELLKNKNIDIENLIINSIEKYYIEDIKNNINIKHNNINPSKVFFNRIVSPAKERIKDIKYDLEKLKLHEKHDNIASRRIRQSIIKSINILNNQTIREINTILDLYNENPNIYKNSAKLKTDDPFYFNIMEKNIISQGVDKGHENLEQIYDQMEIISRRANAKKFSKTFIGSYTNLMNDESYELFNKINEKNIDKLFIKERLKKIASFKNSQDLNETLELILNLKKTSNSDILEYIEEHNINATCLYNKHGKLFLEINDFEASQKLGSKSWCISTSPSYYQNYKKNTRKHIFIYDEKLSDSNHLSKIAFTYDYHSSKITNSHDINDRNILSKIQTIIPRSILNEVCNKVTENNLLFEKNDVLNSKNRRNSI